MARQRCVVAVVAAAAMAAVAVVAKLRPEVIEAALHEPGVRGAFCSGSPHLCARAASSCARAAVGPRRPGRPHMRVHRAPAAPGSRVRTAKRVCTRRARWATPQPRDRLSKRCARPSSHPEPPARRVCAFRISDNRQLGEGEGERPRKSAGVLQRARRLGLRASLGKDIRENCFFLGPEVIEAAVMGWPWRRRDQSGAGTAVAASAAHGAAAHGAAHMPTAKPPKPKK